MLSKIGQAGRTLYYLRPSQIVGQLYYRIYRPQPRWGFQCPTRSINGRWVQGISKRSHLSSEHGFRCLNTYYEFPERGDWDRADHLFLWKYNLHYFDYLNHDGTPAHRSWAKQLTQRWMIEHRCGIGWDPYPTSLRIVNWIRYLLESPPESWDSGMVESLAVQVDHLSRQIEFHIGANHLFTNGKALLFAGCFFDCKSAESWRRTGMRIVIQEIKEQFLADGGHYERSPMYQAILLEDILDLINLCNAYPLTGQSELRDTLNQTVIKGLIWLSQMTLSNQNFPLFGDSANNIAPSSDSIVDYAKQLGIESPPPCAESCYLPNSRFARLHVSSDAVVFATLDGPQPSFQPGHAHADTLSFELYIGDEPILVDTGVPTYASTPERIASRGTAAHNTLQIDEHNSSEVWSSFRVGRRARVKDLAFHTSSQGTCLSASHDGYRFLPGKPVHRRQWQVKDSQVLITDELEGDGEHLVKVRFRAAPGLNWRLSEENRWCLIHGHQAVIEIAVDPAMHYSIEESFYCPEFQMQQINSVLVGTLRLSLPATFVHRILI